MPPATSLYRDMYRALRRLGVDRVLLRHEFASQPGPEQLQRGFAAIRRLSAAQSSLQMGDGRAGDAPDAEADAAAGAASSDGGIAYQRFVARVVSESAEQVAGR